MKIIAFYSFKGGVGRSLTLLNVGYHLARKHGFKVGIIDLDIESSGIHSMLNLKIPDENSITHFLIPQNRKISDIEKYVHKINKFGRLSEVYLMPSISSASDLVKIQWDKAEDVFLRDRIIPTFEKIYNLDFLLVDSRAGVSRLSVSPLSQADLCVVCFRLDKQNQYGIPHIVNICNTAGVPYHSVVSSIPLIKNYKKAIDLFVKSINSQIDSKYRFEVDDILPYMSELYFEELLISKVKPETSLSKAYIKLTNSILQKLAVNE